MDVPSWRIAFLTVAVFSLLSSSPQAVAKAPVEPKAKATASPEAPFLSYEIKPGDTLWKIVQTFELDLDQLTEWNPKYKLAKLPNGTQLKIPLKSAVNQVTQTVLAGPEKTVFSRSGQPLRYHKIYSCKLTAYTAGPESTGKRPGDPAYGITFSGKPAAEGRTIAVDPKVIPLGSKVYIEGIGIRIAEDTGGAIKGDRIDVFFEDIKTALEFGVQNDIRVFLLE